MHGSSRPLNASVDTTAIYGDVCSPSWQTGQGLQAKSQPAVIPPFLDSQPLLDVEIKTNDFMLPRSMTSCFVANVTNNKATSGADNECAASQHSLEPIEIVKIDEFEFQASYLPHFVYGIENSEQIWPRFTTAKEYTNALLPWTQACRLAYLRKYPGGDPSLTAVLQVNRPR